MGYFFLFAVAFHPVPLTILAVCLLVIVLRRTGIWARHKRAIVGASAALPLLLAIDAIFALPRVLYAWSSPHEPVVERRIPLPARLVLVGVDGCREECHKRLLSGAIKEVIHVALPGWAADQSAPLVARRYTADWVIPGTCPVERRPSYFRGSPGLAQKGFCPRTEPVEMPTEGVFVVHERFLTQASQSARPIAPRYLVDSPPGRVIEFDGQEVQVRTGGVVDVVARARSYAAPGLLGVPPLIGCWVRPENIIWTMPVGDAGCGFWRRITGGGSRQPREVEWVFDRVFSEPTSPVTAPSVPALPRPTPAQALEILRNGPASEYLANVKDALVAPETSDEALIELVIRSDRRHEFNGALIAWLAEKRRSVALAIPQRMAPPTFFSEPGALVSAMERDTELRAVYVEWMFDALSATWVGAAPEMSRFLDLVQSQSPGWICANLERVTRRDGILERRDQILRVSPEPMPVFLRLLMERALTSCGEGGLDLLRRVLAWPSWLRREAIAEFVLNLPPDASAALVDQAFANLLDDNAMPGSFQKLPGRNRLYAILHMRILGRAGLTCAEMQSRMEAALDTRQRQGTTPSPQIAERLSMLSAQGDKQITLCGPPSQRPSIR